MIKQMFWILCAVAGVLGMVLNGSSIDNDNAALRELTREQKLGIVGGMSCCAADVTPCGVDGDFGCEVSGSCSGGVEPQCDTDSADYIETEEYAKADCSKKAGACSAGPLPSINCTNEYYCNVDCDFDILNNNYRCVSTGIISASGTSATPTAPDSSDCPAGCWANCIDRSYLPIAAINGL